MIELITTLIIGGLLWQLAIFAVFLLVEGDERTTLLYGMGVFTGFMYIYYLIVNKVRLKHDQEMYNCYWLWANNRPIVHVFMTKEYAKQFEDNSKAENHIELIQFGCDFDKPIDKKHLLSADHLPVGMALEDLAKFYKAGEE